MSWLSIIGNFLTTFGITVAAVLGAFWAAIKLLGAKAAETYFDKQLRTYQEGIDKRLATHEGVIDKQLAAYQGAIDIQLTTHRASIENYYATERQTRQADLDVRVQQIIEKTKGKEAASLEDQKFEQGLTADVARDILAKQNQEIAAQTSWKTEMVKAGLDLDTKTQFAISERRLRPYRELWGYLEPLSPRGTDPLNRAVLATQFRKWYYTSGNGLFLSLAAADAYFLATKFLIADPKVIDDKTVRDAFSALRTQMKIDINIYTMDEARRKIG